MSPRDPENVDFDENQLEGHQQLFPDEKKKGKKKGRVGWLFIYVTATILAVGAAGIWRLQKRERVMLAAISQTASTPPLISPATKPADATPAPTTSAPGPKPVPVMVDAKKLNARINELETELNGAHGDLAKTRADLITATAAIAKLQNQTTKPEPAAIPATKEEHNTTLPKNSVSTITVDAEKVPPDILQQLLKANLVFGYRPR